MNKKNYNIVIVEPSCIVYNGLVGVLITKNKNFHFSRFYELAELDKSGIINSIDVVIINLNCVNNQYKLLRSIKKVNEKTKWVGLINSFYETKDLELFDSNILINDIEEKILNTINKVIEITDFSVNESKQENLSAREIEILKLLTAGFSAKEIAEKLFLSTHTVVTHRKNISQKTGIKSVAGLTIYAIINNIVDPEEYS
ncbi:MAG TPA: LuxR C-terminal-related transcriptional regulator [Melioribacteraceae bacterium]|nr:LuxR C-terminal-related transcriptional regulator [Melioribacteraceae bacterium]